MTYVPPPQMETLRPLDLAQRKDIGPLITSAWRVWRARPSVFLLTAMVVGFLPMFLYQVASVLVVDDFSQRLTDAAERSTGEPGSDLFPGIEWSDVTWPAIVLVVGIIITGLVVPALITATHARAVTALAQGDDVDAGEALRRGLQVFGSAVWALLIYGVLVALGFLLIIPGIWLSIAGLFTSTIVALSIATGFGALRESLRIVRRAGWWRTFGALVVIFIVGYALALIPLAIVSAITSGSGASDGLKIVGAAIGAAIQAALLSWTALATTLLFFSTKSRIGEPWIAPPGTTPIPLPGDGTGNPGWQPQQQGQWGPPAGPGPGQYPPQWGQPPQQPGQPWGPPPGGQQQWTGQPPAQPGQWGQPAGQYPPQPGQQWGQQPPPSGPIFHRPGELPPDQWVQPAPQAQPQQQQPPQPGPQGWGGQPPQGEPPAEQPSQGEQPPRFQPPGPQPPQE